MFSGWCGKLVDTKHNLYIVQYSLAIQKISAVATSVCVIAAALSTLTESSRRGLFSSITITGCAHKLASITVTVSVERDWATTIADGSSDALTLLNTWLRRVDLLCKLVSPLWASLLTSVLPYQWAFATFAAVDVLTLFFELYCMVI